MRNVAFCVDDDLTSLIIIEEYCRNLNIDVYCFTKASDAIKRFNHIKPSIIITDYYMPNINGIELTENIRKLDVDIPIIMFTAKEYDYDIKLEALKAGVNEFLEKPFNILEFKIRVKNLIKLRKYSLERKDRLLELKTEIGLATKEVLNRELETLNVLISLSKENDIECAGHLIRVGHISKIIAKALKYSKETCNTLYYAAQLHDIGKIGIEDKILYKEGPLSYDEFGRIKNHSAIGYNILKGNKSKYLQMGAIIALNHHERYDGTGYPDKLKGEEISVWGRIVAIADVCDALLMKRVYKESWRIEEVKEYIVNMKGSQFDPKLIDVFIENLAEIQELY